MGNLGGMGGKRGTELSDVALPSCVQFIEQLPEGWVVVEGGHVWVSNEPAVVAVVLTGAHQANGKIYVTDCGSQSDEMIALEAGVIAEFVKHASALFRLTPSVGEQPQRDLHDPHTTFGIHLQNATPLSLGL